MCAYTSKKTGTIVTHADGTPILMNKRDFADKWKGVGEDVVEVHILVTVKETGEVLYKD